MPPDVAVDVNQAPYWRVYLVEPLEMVSSVTAVLPCPVVLLGEAYWTPRLEWVRRSALADGMVSPDDLALLREHQSPVLNGSPETGPLRFSQSPEIGRGGCIIQTRFGLIDARRETKIEQLRQ